MPASLVTRHSQKGCSVHWGKDANARSEKRKAMDKRTDLSGAGNVDNGQRVTWVAGWRKQREQRPVPRRQRHCRRRQRPCCTCSYVMAIFGEAPQPLLCSTSVVAVVRRREPPLQVQLQSTNSTLPPVSMLSPEAFCLAAGLFDCSWLASRNSCQAPLPDTACVVGAL